MKIMSYNIYYGGEKPLGGLESRKSLIQSVARKESPDVLGLLECNGWDETPCLLNDYLKVLDMKGCLLAASRDKKGFSFNIALLFQKKIEMSSVFMDNRFFHHGVIFADWFMGKQKMSLALTHLNPFDSQKRLLEVGLILSRLRNKTSAVLMGDLNSLSMEDYQDGSKKEIKDRFGSEFNKMDAEVIESIKRAGFIDSFRYLHPCGKFFTVPTPVSRDPAFSKSGYRLDYIFVSESLKKFIFRSEIIKTKESEKASDHFPVSVEFSF